MELAHKLMISFFLVVYTKLHKQLARLALCSLVLQVKDLGSRAGGFMV